MRRLVLLAFLAIGCQGCPTPAPAPPPVNPPPVVADASATCSGTCTCANMCAHGADLGCSWARPTPAGASCVAVCENNQSANIAPWDLNCRSHAASCNAVDFCN